MIHAKVGVIKTKRRSALDQETVGIQDSVVDKKMILNYDRQNAFASALLDQPEDLGTNVK